MEKLGARLGKLSLKILEHFVGTALGEGFVGELREPTDRELAIESALENSENRFVKEFSDKAFAANMFAQVSDQNLGLISDAIEKFYDHPTDPDFQGVLNQILSGSFPEIGAAQIVSAVDLYIEILTEEFALSDEKFRENVRGLSDLQMVRILRHVEGILVLRTSGQAEIAHDSIGFVPAAKAVTYVHRGKVEDDVISFLRSGGTGAIVGLHAPGGLGKTELAKQAADAVKDLYEGVLWVDVGENTASQVITAMLIQCGVQTAPTANDEMRKSELRAHLQSHKLLLIFDDVRKEALAGLHDILPPKPCNALITSRIQQMSGVKTFGLDHMTVEQARDLMKAILGEDKVNAELDAADQLAERVVWNPLALEIATRRILQSKVTKPIEAFFKKAKQRFPELKMDGDERWDMRKIFDISYDDLTEDDQKRFRTLAVFHSTGFSPAAVAKVWETDEIETGAILSRFMNLSLIMAVESELERHRFHDLLDEYAWLHLVESGEVDVARQIFIRWIVELFDDHYTDDPSSAPEVALELENLRLAAKWALDNNDGNILALLATKPRNWLFNVFRINREWELWLQSADELGITDDGLKANVRKAIGDVQQFRDDREAALVSYNEALKLFKEIGDRLGEANVRKAIGDVQQFRDDREAALVSYNEALKLFKEIGDRLGEANVLQAIGDVQQFRKETQAALVSYNEALKLFKEIGDRLGEANVLQAIGDVQQFRKETQAALVSYNEALKLFKEIGDRLGEANVLQAIGDVQQFRKETQAALVSYNEALKLFKEIGDRLGEANVRKAIGDVQQFRKETQAALVSYNEALKLFKEIGAKLGEANVLQAIGDVQQFRDDREAALVSYNEALKLFKEIGDRLGEANVLMSLGDFNLAQEKWDDAIKYYEQTLPIYQKIQAQLGQANTLIDLGKAYFEINEHEKGMNCVKEAGDIFARIGSGYWAIKAYRRLADMLKRCDRVEEANQIEDQLDEIEKRRQG